MCLPNGRHGRQPRTETLTERPTDFGPDVDRRRAFHSDSKPPCCSQVAVLEQFLEHVQISLAMLAGFGGVSGPDKRLDEQWFMVQ